MMRIPPFRAGYLRQLRLEGERVYLRPMRGKDWRAWATLRRENREFLAPWEPSWPYDALTRGSYRQRQRLQTAEARIGQGYTLHIFLRANDAFAGAVTLSQIRRGVAQTATLGYWIGQGFARQGLMTESLQLVERFAFRELSLHRLEAACLPENLPSQRLLLRLGFQHEGVARKYLRIDGRWRDHLLFAKLVDDPIPAPQERRTIEAAATPKTEAVLSEEKS